MVKELIIGIISGCVIVAVILGLDMTPFLLLGVVYMVYRLLMQGGQLGKRFEMLGGGMSPGSSTNITFADIGGQEEAKREFREALELACMPEKAARLGIRPLKGILLVGPPGTGKTLLAKAAANFTNSVFISASGSQFVEMYAGVGAQRVRQIFKQARSAATKEKKTSAIIFIDEIEVLGGKRGQHSSHLEYDQTLNELLVQMDGIESDSNSVRILVVAATNRADLLDSALLRPGRFDRLVQVELPDQQGRLHILKIHSRHRPLADDVDVEQLAKDTYGFSGAHLEAVMNEASILALRHDKQMIHAADLHEAVDKVLMGEKLDRRPQPDECQRIAYHEAGHAFISEMVRPGSVARVTIVPRGRALGYMRQSPEADQYLYTRQDLLDQISVCLGGAIAEEVFIGSRSTGAVGDLSQAVDLVERLINSGLSDLGVVNPQTLPNNMMHEEMQKVIHQQETFVRRQVEACRDKLQEVALHLLEYEKMSGDDFRRIIGETQPLSTDMTQALHAAVKTG